MIPFATDNQKWVRDYLLSLNSKTVDLITATRADIEATDPDDYFNAPESNIDLYQTTAAVEIKCTEECGEIFDAWVLRHNTNINLITYYFQPDCLFLSVSGWLIYFNGAELALIREHRWE